MLTDSDIAYYKTKILQKPRGATVEVGEDGEADVRGGRS
jgi:hypothetical protein